MTRCFCASGSTIRGIIFNHSTCNTTTYQCSIFRFVLASTMDDAAKLLLLRSKLNRRTPGQPGMPSSSSYGIPGPKGISNGFQRSAAAHTPDLRSPSGTSPDARPRGTYLNSQQPSRPVVQVRPQAQSSQAGYLSSNQSRYSPAQYSQASSANAMPVSSIRPPPLSTPEYAPRVGEIPIPGFPRSAPQVIQKQQREVQVVQGPVSDASEPRNQCADCGRKFNDESFPKHRKICKKVFIQKRKPFDATKIRLQAIAAEASRTGGAPVSLLNHVRSKKPSSQPSKTPGVPFPGNQGVGFPAARALGGQAANMGAKNKTGWREKSAQFRSAIGSIRKENTGSSFQANYPGAYSASKPASQYVCPHCSRGFNEEAGKRHTVICQRIFNNGGRLQKGTGGLSHSTVRKVDATSLRLGGTPNSRPTARTPAQPSSFQHPSSHSIKRR